MSILGSIASASSLFFFDSIDLAYGLDSSGIVGERAESRIQSSSEDESIWRSKIKSAEVNWRSGNYEQSGKDLQVALAIAEKFGDSDARLWETYRKLGWQRSLLGEPSDALQYLDKAKKLAEESESRASSLGVIAALYEIARIHLVSGDFSSAESACHEAIMLLHEKKIEKENHEISRRLGSLRNRIMLLSVEKELGHDSEPEPEPEPEPEQISDTGLEHSEPLPLTGRVATSSLSEAPSFSYEKPHLDQGQIPDSAADPLGALSGHVRTGSLAGRTRKRLDGSSTLRAHVAEMLEQYGTSGVVLHKTVVSYPTVVKLLPGGSGMASGLERGDSIISIDGRETRRMTMSDLHFLLVGKVGEQRALVIKRAGREYRLVLPLWSVYNMRDTTSQYIEYYWFLIYNHFISPEQYNRLIEPFKHALD